MEEGEVGRVGVEAAGVGEVAHGEFGLGADVEQEGGRDGIRQPGRQRIGRNVTDVGMGRADVFLSTDQLGVCPQPACGLTRKSRSGMRKARRIDCNRR